MRHDHHVLCGSIVVFFRSQVSKREDFSNMYSLKKSYGDVFDVNEVSSLPEVIHEGGSK